jgi:chromosome segregation ATPase
MNENSLDENINNKNNNQREENINKADIISFLEKLKLERDSAVADYSNLKMDFNNLKKDYEESQMKLKALEKELINANSKFSFSEQKLHDNFQNLSSTEKKLSQITIQKDSLQRNIDFLEKQLSQYKSTYLDYKSRSEKEINILRADLEEIQKEKEELHKLILSTKSDLNKTIFKLKLLSQENETLKSDNDHLIKILEESNQIVKTSEAKSLSIDNTINEYKKQISELILENDKLKLEIQLQKEYNNKSKDFFTEKISICDQNFEEALNNIRIKMHKKVEDKIREYNELNAQFLNAKIERDKYFGDYTILNQDYNNTKEMFQQHLLDIQKEKQIKENEMSKEIGHLNDKLQALFAENKILKTKNDKLENSNKELEQEKNVREKLEIKNKEINEEIAKIKQDNEDLERKNDELNNKINALLAGN